MVNGWRNRPIRLFFSSSEHGEERKTTLEMKPHRVRKPFHFSSTSSSAHGELENAKIASSNDELILQEHFDSFTSFKEKILIETLPSGYVVVTKSSNMQLHCFACLKTLADVPKLLSSVM